MCVCVFGGGASKGKTRQMWMRYKGSLGKIRLCIRAKHPIDATISYPMMLLRSAPHLPLKLQGRVGGEGTPSVYRLTFVSQSACHSHKHTAESERWKKEGRR